jgi:hypothetical protein
MKRRRSLYARPVIVRGEQCTTGALLAPTTAGRQWRGDVEAVSARVKDHLDAGADHVCIQVFDAEPHGLPLRQWRTLAMAML